MKGDIFSNNYASANGDVFSATGDITDTCQLNLPYPAERIQMLRDRVSITNNALAMAEAERETCYKIWQNCKQKIFASCGGQNNDLDAAEAAKEVAIRAAQAAQADLAQAEKANTTEQTRYENCVKQQNIKHDQYAAAEAAKTAKEELELKQKQLDDANKPIDANKTIISSSIESSTSSPYMKYGLIAVGVGVFVIIGLKLVKH
jgi:hypothetical protein